ncbi:MAG: esterase family protein [Vulcanimicrobiota bacterium]
MSYARHYGFLESQHLERRMEHLVLGHGGAPVLVFPTSGGKFYQWEDFGMLGPVARHLANGWIQLFCIDSVDRESWYNFEAHQFDQLERHLQFEAYLLDEFLPYLRSVNQNPFLMVTGASFGAFHAVNFSFRHPRLVKRVIAMSGDYDICQCVDGYYDDDVYYNCPPHFMPNVTDPELLAAFREMDIILGAGRWDFCLGPTINLAGILERQGIGHRLEVWEDPGIHDWPLWRQMFPRFV